MFHALLVSAALSLGQTGNNQGSEAVTIELVGATEPAAPSPPDNSTPIQIQAPLLPPPAPAAAAAATPPGPASPPFRWLLMRNLQGSYPGSLMDTERFSISGWTDMSFTGSTVGDSNLPLSFNYRANQFDLQQNWIRFDRSIITTGTTPSFGGRVDTIIGTDYRFTLPQRGLLTNQLTENNGMPNTYGIDFVQFYAEGYFPTIGRGLDIKVGRFYTPYGTESLESPANPLVSHAYTFSNGSPFTHTGVLATLTLTPIWTVQAGLVLGSDLFISEADRATFVGSVQWTQPGGRNIIKGTTVLGPGRFEQDLGVNNINIVDVAWTHLFTNYPNSYSTLHPEWTMPVPSTGLSYQLETLAGYQTNVPGIGTATWYSLVNYLNYQFSPRASATARFELFEDSQGQRTGFAGLYMAPAVGLCFKPRPGIILRPELRYDYNDETAAFEGNKSLATVAADVIFRW